LAARVLGDWDAWKWRFAPGWFASLMEKGDRMRSSLELAHFAGARAAPFALGSNIVTRSKAGANYERLSTSSCVVSLGNFRAVSGGTSRGSGDVTVWAVPDAAEDRIESRKNVNQYQMSRIGTPMS
jgi:hypothetical protein